MSKASTKPDRSVVLPQRSLHGVNDLELDRQLAEACAGRAAAETRAAETELVLESLPQIVWITRPDGWHTYFNRQWLDFTGLTLEESLGHGWNPPFHPEDRDRAAQLWAKATSTGEPYEIEYRLRRADGTYHWMLGRAMPLRDATGEVVKWFGTCTDIEEFKQAQVRIEEQARLLDLAQDAIAAALNSEGYRTPRGLRWHARAVAAVLSVLATETDRAA